MFCLVPVLFWTIRLRVKQLWACGGLTAARSRCDEVGAFAVGTIFCVVCDTFCPLRAIAVVSFVAIVRHLLGWFKLAVRCLWASLVGGFGWMGGLWTPFSVFGLRLWLLLSPAPVMVLHARTLRPLRGVCRWLSHSGSGRSCYACSCSESGHCHAGLECCVPHLGSVHGHQTGPNGALEPEPYCPHRTR